MPRTLVGVSEEICGECIGANRWMPPDSVAVAVRIAVNSAYLIRRRRAPTGRWSTWQRRRERECLCVRRRDGSDRLGRAIAGLTLCSMPKSGFHQLPEHGPNPESLLYRTDGCACADLHSRQKLSLGFHVLGGGLEELGYETVRSRTPWLDLVRCTRCAQHWYVATDTVDDDVYMQRLTLTEAKQILEGTWPTYFDSMKHVGMEKFGGPE
jgi:hypothetical protein